MTASSPLIFAVVSGKGGVGKTMITVSLARELARKKRTLFLDADFFNRGLTGLMREGKPIGEIQRPAFMNCEYVDNDNPPPWCLQEVSDGLVHVVYPDIADREINKLESHSAQELADALREFIVELAEVSKCEAIVLDCHGGPDITSFASCLVADYGLLVSEPDRVTMYGTLHFMRKLDAIRKGSAANMYLVFNKVVDDFSSQFLKRVYEENLKQYFDNKPLLAIYPYEGYLTKAFEKTPFLTDAYPDSVLAKKTMLLLRDLLKENRKDYLNKAIIGTPSWLAAWRRWSLGRVWRVLKTDTVIFWMFMVFLVQITTQLIIEEYVKLQAVNSDREGRSMLETVFTPVYDLFQDHAEKIYIFMGLWVVMCFVLQWTRTLDRKISLSVHKKTYIYAIFNSLWLGLLWVVPVGSIVSILFAIGLAQIFGASSDEYFINYLLVIVFLSGFVIIFFSQIYKAYRYLVYRGRKLDAALRLFSLGTVSLMLGVAILLEGILL